MVQRYPLDGAHFKVTWAHQRLEELKRHIALYLDDHGAHTTVVQRQGDVTVVAAPKLYTRPHLDIGGIIGDCLNAMMSSLDYVMWELAKKYAGRPLIPKSLGGTDNVSFPLYVDAAKWQAADFATNRARRYRLPADVVSAIEGVQPYNAGYEPLWLLYVLVNQDKHRLPLLVDGHIKHGPISLRMGEQIATVRRSTASSVAFDAPLAKFPVERSHEMQVDAEIISKFVAFDDPTMPREPVEVTLHNILAIVQVAVFSFDPFFV